MAATRSSRCGVQEVSEGQPVGRLSELAGAAGDALSTTYAKLGAARLVSRALLLIKPLARMQRYRAVATLQARFRGRKVRSRISSVVLGTASRVLLRGHGRHSHAFDRVWARRSTPCALAAWQAEHVDGLHGRDGLRGLLVQSITSRQMTRRKLAEARISAWILRVTQRWYNTIALQCAAAGAPILARKVHADALRQTRSMRGSGGQQEVKFANVQFGKDAARWNNEARASLLAHSISVNTKSTYDSQFL